MQSEDDLSRLMKGEDLPVAVPPPPSASSPRQRVRFDFNTVANTFGGSSGPNIITPTSNTFRVSSVPNIITPTSTPTGTQRDEIGIEFPDISANEIIFTDAGPKIMFPEAEDTHRTPVVNETEESSANTTQDEEELSFQDKEDRQPSVGDGNVDDEENEGNEVKEKNDEDGENEESDKDDENEEDEEHEEDDGDEEEEEDDEDEENEEEERDEEEEKEEEEENEENDEDEGCTKEDVLIYENDVDDEDAQSSTSEDSMLLVLDSSEDETGGDDFDGVSGEYSTTATQGDHTEVDENMFAKMLDTCMDSTVADPLEVGRQISQFLVSIKANEREREEYSRQLSRKFGSDTAAEYDKAVQAQQTLATNEVFSRLETLAFLDILEMCKVRVVARHEYLKIVEKAEKAQQRSRASCCARCVAVSVFTGLFYVLGYATAASMQVWHEN